MSLLGGAAAAAGPAFGPAFAQTEPPKPAQIVANLSGGSMDTAMRKAFFNGFEKKYRIRAVETSPTDNLKFALIAEGVPKDKLYPIDFDRAFKNLDQIKPAVTVWWSTGQQPAQLLLDKEVVLAIGWNGRFYDIIKKGAPIEIEWNEGTLKQGSFIIPGSAKNLYWAQKMLAELSIPQQQAVYASEFGYSGLNLESLNFVDAKVKPYLPPQYLDKQFWVSDAWYADNGAKAAELWNAWMLKKA